MSVKADERVPGSSEAGRDASAVSQVVRLSVSAKSHAALVAYGHRLECSCPGALDTAPDPEAGETRLCVTAETAQSITQCAQNAYRGSRGTSRISLRGLISRAATAQIQAEMQDKAAMAPAKVTTPRKRERCVRCGGLLTGRRRKYCGEGCSKATRAARPKHACNTTHGEQVARARALTNALAKAVETEKISAGQCVICAGPIGATGTGNSRLTCGSDECQHARRRLYLRRLRGTRPLCGICDTQIDISSSWRMQSTCGSVECQQARYRLRQRNRSRETLSQEQRARINARGGSAQRAEPARSGRLRLLATGLSDWLVGAPRHRGIHA